jgi:Domain of unknown function (DUF2019)
MIRPNLQSMTVDQLVERFAALGVEQSKAIDANNNEKYARLFEQMMDVEKEMKLRSGDQRRALMALYSYPNMQVRLAAAKATLATVPQAARQVVEAIAASTWPPQCYDARSCLRMLDEGAFRPA